MVLQLNLTFEIKTFIRIVIHVFKNFQNWAATLLLRVSYTVIPRKLAVPNSRNSQIRGFSYLVAWKPPNWLFPIKIAPYLAVSKFAAPYYPTPKIREFGGITVYLKFIYFPF